MKKLNVIIIPPRPPFDNVGLTLGDSRIEIHISRDIATCSVGSAHARRGSHFVITKIYRTR